MVGRARWLRLSSRAWSEKERPARWMKEDWDCWEQWASVSIRGRLDLSWKGKVRDVASAMERTAVVEVRCRYPEGLE